MLSIRLSKSTEAAAIRAAVRILKKGGVIAMPTETVYGLACDPRNAKAVKQIFKIKGRADDKPLQIIAGSLKQVTALATLNGPTKKIVSRHWPGPLTLLIPLKSGIKLVPKVSPKRTIGIRVSSSVFIQKLALAFGLPIAATSANVSGQPPASSGRGVLHAFQDRKIRPDVLLDAGSIPKRKPSTVAQIHDDGRVEVFRPGAIKL
jgi:L-threonylcarbamoyladenylate synthase